MSGYLIADVTAISDPGLYERYQPLVPPSLRAFNGTYLARGGDVTVLEGNWHPPGWSSSASRALHGRRRGGTQTSAGTPGTCARPRRRPT
jgi:Domain of unknown function (DUF1330)